MIVAQRGVIRASWPAGASKGEIQPMSNILRVTGFFIASVSGLCSVGACSSDSGGPGSSGSGIKAPCITKPSQVMLMGDSYIAGFNSPPLQPALAALIPDAAQYRNYAIAGMSMASGGIPLNAPTGVQFIPQQYDPEALQADPDVKLVILNGGGNDIMLPPPGSPDCKNMANSTTDPACLKIVQDALDAATRIVTEMSDKGVHDVIYFFYPHLPSVAGGLGGTEANVMLDYVYPKAKALCDSAESVSNGKLRCHFIDLRQPYEVTGAGSISGPKPWTNISDDGVHPTAAGQAITAQQIANVMQANCLGQPASSGCCAQ